MPEIVGIIAYALGVGSFCVGLLLVFFVGLLLDMMFAHSREPGSVPKCLAFTIPAFLYGTFYAARVALNGADDGLADPYCAGVALAVPTVVVLAAACVGWYSFAGSPREVLRGRRREPGRSISAHPGPRGRAGASLTDSPRAPACAAHPRPRASP